MKDNKKIYEDAQQVAANIYSLIKNNNIIYRDDFDEKFALAIRKQFNIDNVWDIEVLPNEETVNEFEATVRGILGYMGYGTIVEGRDEGALYIAPTEKEKEKLEKVKELIKIFDTTDSDVFYAALACYEWSNIREPSIIMFRKLNEELDSYESIYDYDVKSHIREILDDEEEI